LDRTAETCCGGVGFSGPAVIGTSSQGEVGLGVVGRGGACHFHGTLSKEVEKVWWNAGRSKDAVGFVLWK